MHGSMRRRVGPGLIAGVVWATSLGAQAAAGGAGSDVCSLATTAEFQDAQGVDPALRSLASTPTATEMSWGPHCDFSGGSVDLFTGKSPSADLDRVLTLTKARTQRDPVSGLGKRAFFTVVYPGDPYRQRGFLAVFLESKIVSLSLDPKDKESPEATRPKLESLAKLVVPRVK